MTDSKKMMIRRVAAGIAVVAVAVGICGVANAADLSDEPKPVAVDATTYTDFMANEALDIQNLAQRAEIQRRFFSRITPPGFSWLQPMLPSVVPFDAANFDESFLDGLLGEDQNSVEVYPLSLSLDPKTRETLVFNADGKRIASIPTTRGSREWPEDSDPARVTVQLNLLPAEDVEPYLYTASRVENSLASYAAKSTRSRKPAVKSLGAGEFGICHIQPWTNGSIRLTVTNGTEIAEVFAYTVLHTAAVVVATWTNEESNVVTDTNTVWTPVSPPFNGIESAWKILTTNLSLSNGVGVWEDTGISSNARVRFYAVTPRMDTDEEGLTDGAEILVYCTDPGVADSDGDGLSDADEAIKYGTDPNNGDTDGDGLPDAWEIDNGLDPLDDGTADPNNGPEGDLDGDGFSNALEFELGAPANNPAWNGAELAYRLLHAQAATRSLTNDLIGLKVEIEDSENCGGTNGGIQNKTSTLNVPDLLAWGYFIDITVEGKVEDKSDYYDVVTFEAFTNTYFFEGNENGNGCGYMDQKTVTRNVLIVPNSTVALRYNTVGWKYHEGAYAEIIGATETGSIQSETVALYPANRARTQVGVAEEVDIKIDPDPGNVTWSVSGGGNLDTNVGPTVRFTAPSNAATCPVTINFSGNSLTRDFMVFEPVGVVDAFFSATNIAIPVGEAGAVMLLQAVVGPTNVSFAHLYTREIGQNATNCLGYWEVNPAPPHCPNDWEPLNQANHFKDLLIIREPYVAPPWRDGGSFEWPIPAQWRIGTTGTTNSMPDWNQKFELGADGTVTIRKFGRWLQRTTNNFITSNWMEE